MEIKIEKLHNQAVEAALKQNWETAIKLNLDIIALDPSYIDAYLGLGFAYMHVSNLKEAKAQYKKALDIDPVNIIAQNNVDKLNVLLKNGSNYSHEDIQISLSPETFMHTEGRTRIVTLSAIGQADVLAMLKIGEHVYLKSKKRRIEVRNKKGEYIGCMPDDISKRLTFFIEAKTEYDTIIKAATKNSVDVFIKETVKGAKVKHYISFPENIQEDLKKIMHYHDGQTVSSDSSETQRDEDGNELFDEDDVEDLDELARTQEDDEDDDLEYLSELEEDDDDSDEDDM